MSKLGFITVLIPFVFSCEYSNLEDLEGGPNQKAENIYSTKLMKIIGDKCLSCHTYHQEGSDNYYDSYDKVKESLPSILSRIKEVGLSQMPPNSANQLTEAEKVVFEQFKNSLTESNSETNNLRVNWTAYKFPGLSSRAGVSGDFKTIKSKLNTAYTKPIDILEGAEVEIDALSVSIAGSDLKTNNIFNFFNIFSSKIIGKVISYDEKKTSIEIEMNGLKTKEEFDVELTATTLILKGKITDLNEYSWLKAKTELEKLCGAYHNNKLWEDVSIEIVINL